MTVMKLVVSPVLHNNVPLTPVAVNIELLQLFSTLTDGVATAEFIGAAVPLPSGLLQPSTVCVTV